MSRARRQQRKRARRRRVLLAYARDLWVRGLAATYEACGVTQLAVSPVPAWLEMSPAEREAALATIHAEIAALTRTIVATHRQIWGSP